jgi:ABC-type multidrug transport system fused ATPase/permease subunit
MVVSKEDFIEHHPELMLEISLDDGVIDKEEGKAEKPGVDITFQNLSLNIKVGETSIAVVDTVTGRLRGKTMTALMGGSGAGKSWWNCHLKYGIRCFEAILILFVSQFLFHHVKGKLCC